MKYVIITILLISQSISQESVMSASYILPKNRLLHDFDDFLARHKKKNEGISDNSLSIMFNNETIVNQGHPNIDNHAEIFAPGKYTNISSIRAEYHNNWMSIELEPYRLYQSGIKNDTLTYRASYSFNNNYHHINSPKNSVHGFRQSRIIIHYKGLGLGYGNFNNWWGPSYHSALSLSSNVSSQKTFEIGTFSDLVFGKFSFGFNIIAIPYRSIDETQLFFSGLRTNFSYKSSTVIASFGFHRTYLSGNFSDLSSYTSSINNWSLLDATKLVFEPIFGHSKKNLNYTIPGTPGFDIWDEMLSGYVKLVFPKDELEIYIDIASDDNRANLTDLRAHWDHTLGYALGFKKYGKFKNIYFSFSGEYLSTKISNTFNPKFYRGPEHESYYAKPNYDYFTFDGRRMGAHSGSSSDDLFFISGIGGEYFKIFYSWNQERHGIKHMENEETKFEKAISLYYNLSRTNYFFFKI